MIALFSEKEIDDAYFTRTKLKWAWIATLILYLAAMLTMAIINIVQIANYRSRALYKPFMIISMVLSVLYWCGTLFFFSTKYRMTKKYCYMLEDMEYGGRVKGEGIFLELDKEIKLRDGVYFYSIILDCPPVKREDITERTIYVERTHALPPLKRGDKVKYVTHANRLVAYEIIPSEQVDTQQVLQCEQPEQTEENNNLQGEIE